MPGPARFAVDAYLHGEGPRVLDVPVSEQYARLPENVGVSVMPLLPRTGQTWALFGPLEGGVLRTGSCRGSRLVSGIEDARRALADREQQAGR